MKHYVLIFTKNNIVLTSFPIFRKTFYKSIKETSFNFYSRLSKCKLFSINAVPVVFTTFHYICHCESFLLTFTFNTNFFSRELASLYTVIIIISIEKNFFNPNI